MGIHNDGTGNTIEIPENKIRGFPANAGEPHKLFHGVGDPAAVFFQKGNGTVDDIPRLGVIEAAGVNIALHLCNVGLRKGLQGRKTLKQGGRDHVDALVRALCGETYGEKQLIVLSVVQRADCLRVLGEQAPDNFIYLFLCAHGNASAQRLSVMFPPHSMVSRYTLP